MKMLNNIVVVTTKIFDNFIDSPKQLNSAKHIYDVYIALKIIIEDTELVANHYLSLDFTEDFLQNSSCGTPQDKWRRVFNEDLEKLNNSIKNYLLLLQQIGFDKHIGFGSGFVDKLYGCKVFYGFVRDEYNVGFIKPCSATLIQEVLNTKVDNRSYHIFEFYKRNLESLDQRVELQKELLSSVDILKEKLELLKNYILKRYSLEDLV